MVRMARPKSSISGSLGGAGVPHLSHAGAFRFMGGGLRETFSREAKQFRFMGAMSGAEASRFVYHDSGTASLIGKSAE
jgi:hypothetical protein